MRKILYTILALFLTIGLSAQFTDRPGKIQLGYQTTANGLVCLVDSIPNFTPSDENDCYLAQDTTANKLYIYKPSLVSWVEFAPNTALSIVDSIQFNDTLTINPGRGVLAWNNNDETLDLGINGVILQIGQEMFAHVKNQTGATIDNGAVVRYSGALGASGRITGDLMVADGTFPAMYTLGIATEDIPNGEDGFVTVFGVVRGVNTSAYDAGDILYVSTTVEGALTDTVPESPNPRIPIAVVLNSGSNGSIFIRPTLFPNLNEINDVDITSPVNGQVLRYDGTKWTNSTERDTSDTNEIQYLVFSNDTLGLTDDPTSVVLPYLDQAEISQIIADTTAVILSYVDQAEQDAKDYADAIPETDPVFQAESPNLVRNSDIAILDTTISSDGTGLPAATLENLFDSYQEIRIDAQLEVGAGTDFIISLVNADSVRQKKLFISGVNNSATYEITISGIQGNPSYVIYTGQSIYLQSQLIAGSYEWVLINQAETVTPSQVVSINRDSAFVERGELQDSIKIKISNKALNPLSPNEIPNLWVWFDADSTAYTAGQLVQTWDDLSGNSYDALYTDSVANSPTLRTDGSNLYLDFDGIDDRLDWPSGASLGSQEAGTPFYTLFLAFDPDSLVSNQSVISTSSGLDAYIRIEPSLNFEVKHGGNPRPEIGNIDTTGIRFYTLRYDATNREIDFFNNGVFKESRAIGDSLGRYTSPGHGWDRIGANIFEGSHFNGKFYSVIGYNGFVSNKDIAGLIGFWNDKYNKQVDPALNQFDIDTNNVALENSTGKYWIYDRVNTDWVQLLNSRDLQRTSSFVVENIDSLRSISIIEENTLIRTKGYYTPNDGGGALYVATQSDGTSDDGFYTILSSNNLYKFTYVYEDDQANIKQGGAKGDGINDDYLAVKTVIEKSAELDKNVYIPSGDFYIKTSDTTASYDPIVSVNESITIFGDGVQSKFTFPELDTLDDSGFIFLDLLQSHTTVKGIHFNVPIYEVKSTNGGGGYSLVRNFGDQYIRVKDNYFTGGYSFPFNDASAGSISFSSSSPLYTNVTTTEDTLISGDNVLVDVVELGDIQKSDVLIITDGINADTTHVLYWDNVTDNNKDLSQFYVERLEHNYSSGATVKKYKQQKAFHEITNNYFIDNPGTAVLATVNDIIIANNLFQNISWSPEDESKEPCCSGGRHAIYIQSGEVTVSDNKFSNSTSVQISFDVKQNNRYSGSINLTGNTFENCNGAAVYTLLGNYGNPKYGRTLATTLNITGNIFRNDPTSSSAYTIVFLKNADELQDTSKIASTIANVTANIFEGNEGGVSINATLFQKGVFSGNSIISTANTHTNIHRYEFASNVSVTGNVFDFSSYGSTEPDGGEYDIRFGRFSGGDPTGSGEGFGPVVAMSNVFKFGRIREESISNGRIFTFYSDQDITFSDNKIEYYSQLSNKSKLFNGNPRIFKDNTIINRWSYDTLQTSSFPAIALNIAAESTSNVNYNGSTDNAIQINGNTCIRCSYYLNKQSGPEIEYRTFAKNNKGRFTYRDDNDFHDLGIIPENSGTVKLVRFAGEISYNDSKAGLIYNKDGVEATSSDIISGVILSANQFYDSGILYGEEEKDIFIQPTTQVQNGQYGYINSTSGKVDTISTYPEYKNFVVRFKETVSDWATSTSYVLGNKVYDSGNVWSCVKDHTSSASNAPSTQATQWVGEFWIRTGVLSEVIDLNNIKSDNFDNAPVTNPTGGTNTVQASNNDIYQATKVITKNTANADSSFVSMFTGTYSTEALISVAATTDSVTVTLPPPSSSLEGHKIKLFNFIVVDNIVTYEILSGQFWSSGVNSTSFEASTDGRIDNLTCIYDPESATYVWAVESNIP